MRWLGAILLLQVARLLDAQTPGDALRVIAKQDAMAQTATFRLRYHGEDPNTREHWDHVLEASYTPQGYSSKLTLDRVTLSETTVGRWRVGSVDSRVMRIGWGNSLEALHRVPDQAASGIGPQFCEGRGLSSCTDQQVRIEEGQFRFEGKLGNLTVRATLDPQRAFVATTIEKFSPRARERGKRMKLTDFRKDSNGFWYASRMQLDSVIGRQSTVIESLQTGLATIETPVWLKRGIMISEGRVEPGIAYEYDEIVRLAGGHEPSLDELYDISLKQRQRINESKKADAQVVAQIYERRARQRLVRVLQVVGVALLAVVLLVLARRLLRPATA